MYQLLKSAFFVAATLGSAAFQTTSAAVFHSPLPFSKTFSAADPARFLVNVVQNEKEESVKFSIQNFSGNRLRCSLKDPDGMVLETVYISGKTGEANRNYLFGAAEEGVYTVEVTDGKEKITKKIDLRRTIAAAHTQFRIQ